MSGLSHIQSCIVRTVKCEVKEDYNFDDAGWAKGDMESGEFWKSIGHICLWPSVTIVVALIIGSLSYILTGVYLGATSNEDKSEACPKTLQSAERSDYVDTMNNDNLEYDRDGIYDFEHTITFGPIKK